MAILRSAFEAKVDFQINGARDLKKIPAVEKLKIARTVRNYSIRKLLIVGRHRFSATGMCFDLTFRTASTKSRQMAAGKAADEGLIWHSARNSCALN